jgi:hypothetical protein
MKGRRVLLTRLILGGALLITSACSAGRDAASADSVVPVATFVSEDSLRQIEYRRHEFHFDPESRKGSLLAFVYDVPYLGACGIFPPRHLLNQQLRGGGGDGGMGPGASWKPFELTPTEYAQLVAAIRAVPPKTLGTRARYTDLQFQFDSTFDVYRDYFDWLKASCAKHPRKRD